MVGSEIVNCTVRVPSLETEDRAKFERTITKCGVVAIDFFLRDCLI